MQSLFSATLLGFASYPQLAEDEIFISVDGDLTTIIDGEEYLISVPANSVLPQEKVNWKKEGF